MLPKIVVHDNIMLNLNDYKRVRPQLKFISI